jgi:hypothetical protein
MAHHHLGASEKARDAYQRGVRELEKKAGQSPDDWYSWLFHRDLQREAKALLMPGDPKPPEGPERKD